MATISSWRDVPLWLWMTLLLAVVLVFSYARSAAAKGNNSDDEADAGDDDDTPSTAATAFPLFVAGGADSITGSAVPPTMAGRTSSTSPYYSSNTANYADTRGTSSPTSVTSTGQDQY